MISFSRFGLKIFWLLRQEGLPKECLKLPAWRRHTIHRLLEHKYDGDGSSSFQKMKNLLEAQVLIIDEVSMVDLILYSLLKAVPPGCRLIMVGDVDQLPSVGAGSVFETSSPPG